MTKTIKVTSLIGLMLEAFLSLMFLIFFVLSVLGVSHSEVQTTVNGKTTMQSAETSSHIFNWIFGTLLVASIISLIIGLIAFKTMSKNMNMSAVLYIIGSIVSLNLITIFTWIACGVLLIKEQKQFKEGKVDEKRMVD
ncbi:MULTISPECIES: DUF4064 domain-containing protein [Staphylococcus]|uniref:DUF4064 domain-containing protein n=1 Tax=Staphylococcus lugdunensis TaxID=28035 RepID=A0ABD4EH48_STALU|nr:MULTISPECIES: DUF4064 domain-containing protein [Staphylococcus]AMG64936.1 DUF4064 domain-containing protein [Staphylococcus lugdunensis]EFU84233.1 hypothetical protein HMPREF0790_0860 [Staphylococcus lugdunensis M23590]KXA39193.1 hypothetical protein HMPREF3225_00824 [Staphylococcus lugdunensis]MCI2814110.1 DUF4064 domain-containing protein [Staphylococcus lugdunensis]MDU0966964.1 DUF4064 domain-containing protein [Staphylococcus lugdunensis]